VGPEKKEERASGDKIIKQRQKKSLGDENPQWWGRSGQSRKVGSKERRETKRQKKDRPQREARKGGVFGRGGFKTQGHNAGAKRNR